MHIVAGVALAFWLGYLTSSWRLLDLLLEEQFVYCSCGLCAVYLGLFFVLERIADTEAQQVSSLVWKRTSRSDGVALWTLYAYLGTGTSAT
ncbi:hypothetical protein BDF14DRAFT_1815875 [Spinellus fusiger]|nr:hypothetical protein BDF14DRAFT_1815875 [Spinellus fusiger]